MSGATILLAWLPQPARWPGIIAKLRQQAAAAARCGLPVRIVAAIGGPIDLGTQVETVRCDLLAGAGWALRARLDRYALLRQAIPRDADRIVLRMPGAADPSLPAFLQRWGRRLVTEHHGDVIAERLRTDYTLAGRLRAAAEACALRILLRGGAGLVGVTPEIAAGLARHAPAAMPVTWVGNGVDADGMPPTGCRRYSGGELVLAVLCGNPAPWHGLDRLVAGLRQHRGPHNIVLHLIGGVDPGLIADLGPYAQAVNHGRLDGADLNRVLGQAHLGISSLALHRAGLVQACPLKSREFAARGLPFAYAYDDPDLPPKLPWCLRLADGDEAVDVAHLFAFAQALPDDAPTGLRGFASEHLDWSAKLRRLHDFAVRACA